MSHLTISARGLLAGVLALGLLAVAGTTVGAPPAHATDKIIEYTMTPSTTQAGGHPDLNTYLFNENYSTGHFPEPPEPGCYCNDPRSIAFDTPAGVIADPHAVPQCSQVDFAQSICPIDSQVGDVGIGINYDDPNAPPFPRRAPVFNLTPHPNQAGLLGFEAPILGSPIYIIVGSRTESDYGLSFRTLDITHLLSLGLRYTKLTIWGVPADPSHDGQRLGPAGCESEGTGSTESPFCVGGFKSNSPLAPYTFNPTTCGEPLTATAEVISYDLGTDTKSTPFPATTGCDLLSFNPSLFGQPTTTEADTASGFDADLKVPPATSPVAPTSSDVRAITGTLPEGFSINSNAGDGKVACTEAEAHFGVRELAAECPEFSRVGTVSITSVVLPGPLEGFLYLGEPKPGERYRLFLVVDGFGLHVKLHGSAVPDPTTGRVTVTFPELPQFPFSDINLHFFGSERGLLATPTQCGTYPVATTFTPWDAALSAQTSTQFFTLDSGPNGTPCPGKARPFNPGFQAGVADKTAGQHSPFTLELTRDDGDQNLTGVSVIAPPGFSASLRGIPYCSNSAISQIADASYSGVAEQASSACPAASQVGTVTAGAGAGSRPVHVTGKAYLAGPYKGAPLSLEVVVPAVSGPYDLGNVADRVALHVDPTTAQVTAISDPLPQIVGGIPLRTRSIQVNLDRKEFALNPTNCEPFAISAMVSGDQGAQVQRENHFQVADCADLPYHPKLSLRLTGGVQRRGHPAIHATLQTTPGEANTRNVSVLLPAGEQLDQGHIGNICTRVAFAQEACPANSVLGTAEATTPLLDQPLKGNVYLRANPAHKLPDLAIDLRGQINIELVGRIDSLPGRLRTRFQTVPDAPISSFVLNLLGGSKGLLQNTESLCGKDKRAAVRMIGQNGVTLNTKTELQPQCGASAKHKRHHRHGAGR